MPTITATPNTRALDAYRRKLAALPAPGSGGCHTALLGAATLGVAAGLSDLEIIADLRSALPPGTRPVQTRELEDAAARARLDTRPGPRPWNMRPIPRKARPAAVVDWARVRAGICAAGGGEVDPYGAELWEASPVRITWPVESDALEFLPAMYGPDEFLFIGHREAKGVTYCRTLSNWLDEFAQLPPNPPQFSFMVPNPVTGKMVPTKSDPSTSSYRALGALAAWRYAVVEFDRDDMPKPRQLAFWRGLKLPNVCAVVDSGGKSLHAWLRVNAPDAEAWDREVRPLFARLGALGADDAGQTGGQLCRLPGVPRPDKGPGAWQRLLWFCPEGGCLR